METVYLHGFATSPSIWHAVLRKPAPIGSGRFPELSFGNIKEEAKRIGRELGEGIALIGWSMGGMIAIKIAADFPKKIKSLVLVSTTPKFIGAPCGAPLALLRRLEKRIKAEGAKAFHLLAFSREIEGLAHPSTEQALQELKELEKIDLRKELLKIKAATLIIHGNKDEICLPAAAEYMRAKIRNSRLEILSGVKHAPMFEAPEVFSALINNHVG